MYKIRIIKVLLLSLTTVIALNTTAQITEGFESGLPKSFGNSTVTLGSGNWQISNVIQNTDLAYVQSGTKSAQIRNSAESYLITPQLSGGVGTISFYCIGTVAEKTYQVQTSTDNGTNWLSVAGSPFTAPTTKTQITISINNASVNKVKIINNAGMVFYVDDFVTTTSGPPSPILTAAPGATVDNSFDITFTDDAIWRNDISGITVDGTPLTAGFVISSGKITLIPSNSVPTSLLQNYGTKNIVVLATGYSNANVTQPIAAGAATQMTIKTEPAAPAVNASLFATQPTVDFKDQYGNTTSSTATVTASVAGGNWTLSGTTDVAAVSGTASFTNLTATRTTSVSNAQLIFTSGALSVTSSTFNIPALAFVNAGLEDATSSPWALAGATITTTASEVFDGLKGVKMVNGNQFYQILNLQPNTNYSVSCIGKGTGNFIYLGVSSIDPDVFISNVKISSSNFQKYNINFTTTAATNYKIWVWTDQVGTYYVDNFEIVSGGIGTNNFAFTGSGNWSVAANWTPQYVPANGANITVNNGSLVVDQNATLGTLTVNSGKHLSLSAGKTITATSLTLKSNSTDGTATFVNNGGTLTVSGSTNIEQYLGTTRNWYVSSPVTNAKAPANYVYYQYNEVAGDWTSSPVSVADNLIAGVGYIVLPNASGSTLKFTTESGGSINSGNVTIPLTASKNRFNLIGNPYPAHLTWTKAFVDDVTNAALIEPTIWYRTNTGSVNNSGQWSFKTVNASTGEASPLGTTANIPPMQAFWVRAKSSGNLVLNSMLTQDHNSANPLKAPCLKKSDRQRVRLEVSNGTTTDETLLYFDATAENGYDKYDSPKMFNNSTTIPEIYTLAGTEKLVINGLNTIMLDTEIPLGFATGTSNSFTLKATEITNLPIGVTVLLKDNIENSYFDLSSGSEYNFSSDVINSSNRFSIVFRTLGAATKLNNPDMNNVQIFRNEINQIQLKIHTGINSDYRVSVCNSLGQNVFSGEFNSNSFIINKQLKSGMYLVYLCNGAKTTTQKVILY